MLNVVLLILLVWAAFASAASAQTTTPRPPAEQGRIVALSGRVEHTPAPQEQWSPARMLQPLLVAERVRTFDASRASILLIDETQVKLNAGAVLTIRALREAGASGTTLDLSRGEAWFRTKNPRSGLTIQTPAAAAAVRGTEINVRLGASGETILTVIEGAAEFSNPQGSVFVNAGEEGTALPGQAPTKRVILNPEHAVQWALYYPARIAWRDLPAVDASDAAAAGFARLRADDTAGALQAFEPVAAESLWSRIGMSMAYFAAGNVSRASAALLPEPLDGDAGAAAWRSQRAAVLLGMGDAAGARREFERALATDPAALPALIGLSSLNLRQNDGAAARDAADRALAAHPRSVGALVAASEAAQSRFDLAQAIAYLDRALALDPDDVHALVNRARLRFGTDDTRGARADAGRAATRAPDDAQVRSLGGFIHLADGDVARARADFDAAAAREPAFGEPHLGLGLVHFRSGRVEQGLEAMLSATLLEPNVALYQSYLGKAYYQAGRFREGLSALASAKRLDPRDPTPWLYASLYLRDQNQQVDALNELRHAIALNDFRAVYRSRLLLDRDLATKNVSLAEIYRQLGFEAWGASEALHSLETDGTNSSAHLFLAETYGGLPDRTQALGSELLQYFLYAPVNRNSFNNFAEYTALLEQPRRQLSVTSETGSLGRAFGSVEHRGGNERFAHVAFLQASRQEGHRLARDDDRVQGFFQGKLALGSRSDLFVSVHGVRDSTGDSDLGVRVFGLESETPVILRRFTPPDPRLTAHFRSAEATLGVRHQWRPGSALTAVVRYEDLERRTDMPDSPTSICTGFNLSQIGATAAGTTGNPFRSVDVQIQQATRIGRHQLIIGHQSFSQDKRQRCAETIRIAAFNESLDLREELAGEDTATVTQVRDEIRLTRWLQASIGLAHQQTTYEDLSTARVFEQTHWNPRLGLSARVSPSSVVRAAHFRQLNTNFLGSFIAPSTVAGFVTARNEFPTARRSEFGVALEHSRRRTFVAIRGFTRHTTVPFLLTDGRSPIPEADADHHGAGVHVNRIVTRRLTVFGENQLVRLGADAFVRYDNTARMGVNVIHPRGVFVRVTGAHVRQRFTATRIADLPPSDFVLADLDLAYEFAAKRGLVSLRVTNAFDRRFAAIVDAAAIEPFIPDRRLIASLRWRLW
jgi:tetratricopeptide (TPR) repeat protein